MGYIELSTQIFARTKTPLPALPFCQHQKPHRLWMGNTRSTDLSKSPHFDLEPRKHRTGLLRGFSRPLRGGDAGRGGGFDFNQSLGVSSFRTSEVELRKKKTWKPTNRCWKVTYDSAAKKKNKKNRMLDWMKMYFKCSYEKKKDGKLFQLPL